MRDRSPIPRHTTIGSWREPRPPVDRREMFAVDLDLVVAPLDRTRVPESMDPVDKLAPARGIIHAYILSAIGLVGCAVVIVWIVR